MWVCRYMVMKIEISCLNVGVKAIVANIYSLNCATHIFNECMCVCVTLPASEDQKVYDFANG